MDFSLTEEHQKAQQMVRDFALKEVYPTIKEWDRKQEMNPAVLPRMGELGILGINIPVRYGGQGFDYLTLALVCEELERIDTTLRVIMSVHMGLNSMALLQWGSEDQKQKFLIPQAQGERYAAFCLTEPDAGSDPAAMRTRATKTAGGWVLTGAKRWITNGTRADVAVVWAKTGDDAASIRAFLVPRGTPG
ncbi:MAG TPA: acyl-CoA dehydrogenase family protein, partial [Aggregatilineales bacterium]|nr:acyl-CoA dehydrogenase family protein [Aggregatilineales bacterium]